MTVYCPPASGSERQPAMSERRSSPRESSASPALGQLSVGPIPKQVEDNLAHSSLSIRKRFEIADISADMLPAADCNLHLRYNVPFGLCSSHEITVGDELHHRRPQAAKALIG